MKAPLSAHRIRALASAALLLSNLTACATQHNISSASPPGTPIISYPISEDHTWSAVLQSSPLAMQAGVNGRVLMISTLHHNKTYADQLAVDLNGNVGIRGSLSSLSSRAQKYDIFPYKANALDLLRNLDLVTYRYRGETSNDTMHIGFIAEDAPSELSGTRHNAFNLDNSIAVTMSATKQLDDDVRRMQSHIDALEREVVILRREAAHGAGTESIRKNSTQVRRPGVSVSDAPKYFVVR